MTMVIVSASFIAGLVVGVFVSAWLTETDDDDLY